MKFARLRLAPIALLALIGAAGVARGGLIEIIPISNFKATATDVKLRGGGTAPTGTSQGFAETTVAGINTYFDQLDKFNGNPTLGEETFAVAFSNWNSANGNNWNLIDGGDLDISFNILATAMISRDKATGGLDMNILTSDYKRRAGDPTLAQLGWSQAVIANFQPGVGHLDTPAVTLDTFTTEGREGNPTPLPAGPDAVNNTKPSDLPGMGNPGYADPLYPFLVKTLATNTLALADTPMGAFPDSSFRAISLLSTVMLRTDATGKIIGRDLTVYNGVSWGFDLSVTTVPEPASAALMALGLMGLAALGRLRHRRSAA